MKKTKNLLDSSDTFCHLIYTQQNTVYMNTHRCLITKIICK